MADSGEALRALFVKLGFDVDEEKLDDANNRYTELKSKLELLVGAAREAWGAVSSLTAGVAENAQQVKATATQIGVATGELQELQHAAEVSDSSAEAMTKGLLFLARNAHAASLGSAEAANSFRALGVRLADAEGRIKTPAEMVRELADRFRRLPDGTTKAALAMRLFGDAGAQLIPVLNQGRDGLAELGREARELGVVFDQDALDAAGRFDDASDAMNTALKGLRNTIGSELLPLLTPSIKGFTAWVRENRELIKLRVHQAVKLLGKAFKALKALLTPISDGLKAIANDATALKVVLAALATVMTVQASLAVARYVTSLGALTAAHFKAKAAALLNQGAMVLLGLKWMAIAAIAALVVLAIEEVYTTLTGGDSYIKDLSKAIDDWWEKAEYKPDLTWWDDFLTFLKSMLYTVTHIGETFENWKWFLNRKDSLWSKAKGWFGAGDDKPPAGPGGANPAASRPSAPQEPLWSGGAVAPAAAAALTGGAPAISSQSQVSITVNAQTNASADDIASKTAEAFRDAQMTAYREALAQLE